MDHVQSVLHIRCSMSSCPCVSISVPCDFEEDNLCGWTSIHDSVKPKWTTGMLPDLLINASSLLKPCLKCTFILKAYS